MESIAVLLGSMDLGRVRRVLAQLTIRERGLLTMHVSDLMTLDQIAHSLGVTSRDARQELAGAYARLRAAEQQTET